MIIASKISRYLEDTRGFNRRMHRSSLGFCQPHRDIMTRPGAKSCAVDDRPKGFHYCRTPCRWYCEDKLDFRLLPCRTLYLRPQFSFDMPIQKSKVICVVFFHLSVRLRCSITVRKLRLVKPKRVQIRLEPVFVIFAHCGSFRRHLWEKSPWTRYGLILGIDNGSRNLVLVRLTPPWPFLDPLDGVWSDWEVGISYAWIFNERHRFTTEARLNNRGSTGRPLRQTYRCMSCRSRCRLADLVLIRPCCRQEDHISQCAIAGRMENLEQGSPGKENLRWGLRERNATVWRFRGLSTVIKTGVVLALFCSVMLCSASKQQRKQQRKQKLIERKFLSDGS